MKCLPSLLAVAVLFCGSHSHAQIIFQDDLTDGSNWTTIGTNDSLATFAYDYSADSIPEAPNSLGGAARTGLKMEANLFSGTPENEIAALPNGVNVSGRYRVQADIWTNYTVGGAGTTEFAGIFVGHDGVTPGRIGAGTLYTSDGDASRDYRLYKDFDEVLVATGQYSPPFGDIDPAGSNNNQDPTISAAFPGVDIGMALDPADGQGASQTGIQADGVGGFQWMTMEMIVDTDGVGAGNTATLGTVETRITSAASGNTLWVGTVDNTAGDAAAVNMSGTPALVYFDLFSSVASNPAFSFGLFDNFLVEQITDAVDGDFDENGLYECNDVDQLVSAIVDVKNGGTADLTFDITGDGNVADDDLAAWLAEAGSTGGLTVSGNPVQIGDATLDGVVDGLDFIEWNDSKFTSTPEWCGGDFNADGIVDGLDFIEWNNNKFTSADAVAVPEPSALAMLVFGISALAIRTRK